MTKYFTKRPTIFDVAKLAGVSISSVSRVINNRQKTKESTSQNVIEAINKLNYLPNIVAQGLATKRIKTIGIIITDITNPFLAELVREAEKKANDFNYNVIFCNTDESVEREAKYIKVLSNSLVSGFIISATRMSDENIYNLKNNSIPFVLINRYLLGNNIPCVRCDYSSGMQKAVHHLVKKGHKKILLLNGPKNSQASRLKEENYINLLAKYDILYNPDLNQTCQPNKESGFSCLNKVIDNGIQFTAIITYNDLIALGALEALRNRKIRVPHNIAMVSFGDSILAAHSNPPLTSIHLDSALLGKLSMEMLIKIIEGEDLDNKEIVLKPKLIVRESSIKTLL